MPGKKRLTNIAKRRKMTPLELCQQALEANGGNVYKAAQSLKVYPNAIYHHLRKAEKTVVNE